MQISVIGNSGAGKSCIASKLEQEADFIHICIDDLVQVKLGAEIPKDGDITDVAGWMGHPYEEHYAERSKRYLALEEEALRETLDSLIDGDFERQNLIIATTGSVIYLPSDLLQELCSLTDVIFLEQSAESREELFERFKTEPKPIYWGNCFVPNSNEENEAALQRCYRDLIYKRKIMYSKFAAHRLPAKETRELSGKEIFSLLKEELG